MYRKNGTLGCNLEGNNPDIHIGTNQATGDMVLKAF